MEGTELRKILLIFSTIVLLVILAACGNNDDELPFLEVDFIVPDSVDVDETIELKAIVTYGDESVTDADEVVFEVWEKNDRDNGDMLDAINHEDGTYTVEVSFDHDGIFEMYAHTTARDMHTMPLKEIVVGAGGEYEDDEETVFHTEGFELHFVELEDITAGESADLVSHIQIHDEPLESAKVRYEIWSDEMGDNRDWVDASENVAGEYSATYSFESVSTYHIQVHVEDDADLHEHVVYDVEITQ